MWMECELTIAYKYMPPFSAFSGIFVSHWISWHLVSWFWVEAYRWPGTIFPGIPVEVIMRGLCSGIPGTFMGTSLLLLDSPDLSLPGYFLKAYCKTVFSSLCFVAFGKFSGISFFPPPFFSVVQRDSTSSSVTSLLPAFPGLLPLRQLETVGKLRIGALKWSESMLLLLPSLQVEAFYAVAKPKHDFMPKWNWASVARSAMKRSQTKP